MPKCRAHRLLLFLGKRNAQAFAHRFQRRFDILSHTDVGKPFGNHAGGVVLLPEHTRAVQVLLIGDHCAVQNHLLQGFLHLLGADALFRDGNRCVEQQKRFLYQIFRWQKQMSRFAAGILQRVQHRAFDALGAVQAVVRLADDAIHTLEAEAGNLAQVIRAFFEDVHARRAKVLIDFQRRGGRDFERPQKAHKVAQDAALGVGFLNVLEFAFGDAADLQQLLRLVIKDIQGVRAECGDNVLCRLGADAFDKPGAQVSQQAVRCLWNNFLPLLDLQLIAVLALDPLTVQFQLYRLSAGQFVPHRRKAQHSVAVVASAASLRRDARVTGLDNDDGEFVCFIVKNRRFVGDTATGNAAVFLFTVVHRHAPFFVRRLPPPLLP